MSDYQLSPAQLEDARAYARAAFGLSDEQAASLEGRTRQDVVQACLKLSRERKAATEDADPAELVRKYGRRYRGV